MPQTAVRSSSVPATSSLLLLLPGFSSRKSRPASFVAMTTLPQQKLPLEHRTALSRQPDRQMPRHAEECAHTGVRHLECRCGQYVRANLDWCKYASNNEIQLERQAQHDLTIHATTVLNRQDVNTHQ